MRTVQTIGVPATRRRRRRRRRGRRRAQVAHDPRGGRGGAVARCAGVAARRAARGRSSSSTARPSIRPTPATSARSPTRCWTRSARDFTIACPAFPENRPHDLSRPPVRRRRAAVGFADARPSADADDAMPTSCACWRAQTRRRVGLVPLAGRRARRRRRSAPRSRELARDGVAHAVVDAIERRRSRRHRRGVRATSRWSPAARASRSACRRTSAPRACCRHAADAAALPQVDGAAAVLAGSCSAATRGQVAACRRAAPRGRRSIRCARRMPTRSRRRRSLGRGRARRRAEPCSSTRAPTPDAVAGGAGATRPRASRRRWSSDALGGRRARTGRARACAGWSSPAARRRARSCRRSA